jgi:hypothetical protein
MRRGFAAARRESAEKQSSRSFSSLTAGCSIVPLCPGQGFFVEVTGLFPVMPAVPGAEFFRIKMDEFRAEEEDLRGIIPPEDHDHQGTCGSIHRSDRAFREIHPKEEFTHRKQERGYQRSEPHIAPNDFNIGNHLEDHGEKEGGKANGNQEIRYLEGNAPTGHEQVHVFSHRGKISARDHQRPKNDEDSDDNDEGGKPRFNFLEDAGLFRDMNAPDDIEGVAEVEHDLGRAESEGEQTEGRGDDGGRWTLNTIEDVVDGLHHRIGNKWLNAFEKPGFGLGSAEHKAEQGDHENEQGSDGKDGIICQSSGKNGDIVFHPCMKGSLEQPQEMEKCHRWCPCLNGFMLGTIR